LLRLAANSRPKRTPRRQVPFARLKQSGATFKVKGWLLVNYLANRSDDFGYGFTIPRYVGIAVVRNRLRRWSREFCRRHSHEVQSFDVNILFLRKSPQFYRELAHAELDAALAQMVRRLRHTN
jgi:ribonuclease P protein component